jgi:hypothetical protein
VKWAKRTRILATALKLKCKEETYRMTQNKIVQPDAGKHGGARE